MVRISEILKHGTEILAPSISQPRFEAELLLAHVLGKDRLCLSVHRDDYVKEEDTVRFDSICRRRASGEPMAYITGIREFMSLEFEVNPSVLIPRPDTELTVEWITENFAGKKADILDICTGSGAIACSLAHFMPDASVTGLDISSDALEVAKRNSVRTRTSDKVEFLLYDALNIRPLGKMYDVVVSNPPYIESETIETLDTGVRDFEPRLALDGGMDGLDFYRSITSGIEHLLKKGGMLVFEIGYNQGSAVKDIMSGKFAGIHISKDFAGNDRMVYGQLA